MEGDQKLGITERLEINTDEKKGVTENMATIFDIKDRIFEGFIAEDK